jgi:hypothetical protein
MEHILWYVVDRGVVLGSFANLRDAEVAAKSLSTDGQEPEVLSLEDVMALLPRSTEFVDTLSLLSAALPATTDTTRAVLAFAARRVGDRKTWEKICKLAWTMEHGGANDLSFDPEWLDPL